MSAVAMCDRCHEEPLVSTFHWRNKEFVCLKCGRLFGWLDPKRGNETSTRLARMDAREAEWKEHASDFLTGGAWHVGCEECDKRNGYHITHATEDEWAAHRAAQEWLLVRTGRADSNTEHDPVSEPEGA